MLTLRTQPNLLLTFVAVAFLASCVLGQSGRKHPQAPDPSPQPTPANASAPTESAKITSLLVTGDIVHDSQYFKSNYMEMAIKEFANTMKGYPKPFFAVTRGGKMKIEAAKERAKNETEVHVLWLGVITEMVGIDLSVQTIDYAIFMPSTGKMLLSGSIVPGQQRVVGQGGVMTIPRMRTRPSMALQMEQGARELAYRLKGTGWF